MPFETETDVHYFTFGVGMVSTHPDVAGLLGDYWVEVHLSVGSELDHRTIFIDQFTRLYMSRPDQFAFEYDNCSWKPEYFPKGCLCVLKPAEDGA
jgi:hypothetical protein